MKQGGKSKTGLAIGCALALLMAVLALAPAAALGSDSAAEQEYQNAPIPHSGDGGGPQSGGDQNVTGSSDGGGAPILLIALAVIAAACTGLAIWRLRKPEGPNDPEGEGGSAGVTGESRPL